MVIYNTQPVQLMQGLRIQWTPSHDMFISQITDVSAATIDCWYAANTDVIKKWPTDEPYRALLDFAFDDHVYVTPRAKAYAERLFGLRPELTGRMAVLIRPSISAHSIEIFVHRHSNKDVIGGVFYDRERAMTWLAEA